MIYRAVPAVLAACLILSSADSGARRRVPPSRQDTVADSLFDAGLYDALLRYASAELDSARARRDPLAEGRMTFVRGRARLALRIPGARDDFDRAHALAVAHHDTIGQINAIGLKSFVAVNDGRLRESIELNEHRLALAQAIGFPRGEGWARLLIGYACLVRGESERALAEYEGAARAFRAAGRPRDELRALIGWGRALDQLGRLDESREACERALATAQALGDSVQEADLWNNLAKLEFENGNLSRAARDYRRAYDLKIAARSPDAPGVARNIALANAEIGRYAAAESILVDAIRYARGWHYELVLGDLFNQLGWLRLAQARPHGAAGLFRQTLARGDSVSVRSRTEAVAGLAEALLEQDSVSAAVGVLDAELVSLEAQPPYGRRALALTTWSRCLRAAGRIDDAARAAGAAWDDALARADTSLAITAAVERSACRRAAGDTGAGFAWFDRARALFASATRRSDEYQWREAERIHLSPRLVACAEVLLEWPPDRARPARERAFFDALQEMRTRTLLERLASPGRNNEGAPRLDAPVTARELQQEVLRDGECLLDLTAARDHVFAFAVTRDSLRMIVVDDPGNQLRRRTSALAGLMGHPPRAGAPAVPVEAARPIADLLAGFDDLIAGSRGLVIAADGWLASVPFGALPAPGAGGRVLAEEYRVTIVPGASAWRFLRSLPPAREASAGILAFSGGGLPGAREEVEKLASRYLAVTRKDSVVSPESFLAAARAHDVIHVASHIRVNSERPWHSGIQIGSDAWEDPYLRASTLAHSRVGASLVVLSGCESALGRATQGEAVLGLTSALFCAGTRSVVASLWPVDDRATADLMGVFYRGLAAGETVSDALRHAQMHVRQRHAHPFYWAGFVALGDGDITIPLSPRPRSRILMVFIALGAGAAVMGSMWWRRRRAPAAL